MANKSKPCTYKCNCVLKYFYLAAKKLKSIFGAILTVLGVAGLIYAALLYVNDAAGLRALVVYRVLGFIFFISG